jgi:hypothetical protein
MKEQLSVYFVGQQQNLLQEENSTAGFHLPPPAKGLQGYPPLPVASVRVGKEKSAKDDKTNITVVPATRKIELVTLPDIQMRNGSITVRASQRQNKYAQGS